MDQPEFEFQRLDVYQRAMDLRPLITALVSELPPGEGDLRSQLRRSERSIRLNIAEGSGKHRPGGKVERFRTARGSANECAAGLDEILKFRLADRRTALAAANLVHRIIAMLTKLILYWEKQAQREEAEGRSRRRRDP